MSDYLIVGYFLMCLVLVVISFWLWRLSRDVKMLFDMHKYIDYAEMLEDLREIDLDNNGGQDE